MGVGDDAEFDGPPNVARAFDLAVGGTEHFEVDREFMAEVRTVFPLIDEVCRHQWTFTRGAAAHLAGQGYDQFLVLGSGLPSADPIHAVAARHLPDGARPSVVYVDIDPVTVEHGRRLVADDPSARTAVLEADVAAPAELLALPALREVLDLDRPLVVVASGVLEYVDDAAVARLFEVLASTLVAGSAIMVSAPTDEGRDDLRVWAQHDHTGYSTAPRLRPFAQVRSWLDGWRVPDPGWCSAPHWRAGATEVPGADVAGSGWWAAVAYR